MLAIIWNIECISVTEKYSHGFDDSSRCICPKQKPKRLLIRMGFGHRMNGEA